LHGFGLDGSRTPRGISLVVIPAPALKPSPFLNQHEEEVLEGIFGFSAAERAALQEAVAISSAAEVKG
jgi:hypothetical protein